MKKLISPFLLLLISFSSNAQKSIVEEEIKRLEAKAIQAVLDKDSSTLRKIWANDFMVNAPVNRVVIGGQVDMVMAGRISYTTYTYEMEQIVIKEDIVITMGNETVVPVANNPKGGQTIKRRYTHFWAKENGNWKLFARHANEVCQ